MRYIWLVIVTSLVSSPILANNGLTLTSYGARSAGMGGSTLAVGGSVMDLQSNPANLARNRERILEAGAAVLIPSLIYNDSFYNPGPAGISYANRVESESAAFPLPFVGYTAPIDERSGWGVAFYAQGGLGAEFNGILRNTPGNQTLDQNIQALTRNPNAIVPGIGGLSAVRENTYSNLGFAKLTPGYAIRLGRLSLGLGLDFGVGRLNWRLTFSDPSGSVELPGAGYRYESRLAYSFSGKAGLTYDLTDEWAVAYSYTAISRLPLDGKISVNQGDPQYFRRAGVSTSLSFPEQHFAGIAYKSGALTLSAQIGYIKWSNVLKTQNFTLDAPWVATPIGVNTNRLTFNTNWRDQPIYSAGIEYKPEQWAYRAGYNYGPAAQTSSGLNPLFPGISEHHAFVGLGRRFDGDIDVDFAIEYALPSTVEGTQDSDWTFLHAYNGTGSGFGNPYYKYSVSMRQIIPHISVKTRF